MASKKEPSNSSGMIIGFIVLVLIVVFGASFYTKSGLERNQDDLEESSQLLQNKVSQLESELTNLKEESAEQKEALSQFSKFIYKVERTDDDTQVLRTDTQAGVEEVLVESVRELAQEEEDDVAYLEHAVFSTEGKIAFWRVFTGSGADEKTSPLDLWVFDATTNTMSQVEDLTEIITTDGAINLEVSHAPDKRHSVFVNTDQEGDGAGSATTLWVFDAIENSIATVLSLPTSQTFNAGVGYPQSRVTITWEDAQTITAEVYEQEGELEDELSGKPLVETKEIVIE